MTGLTIGTFQPISQTLLPYRKSGLIVLGILTVATAITYAMATPAKFRNIQLQPAPDTDLIRRANQAVLKAFPSVPFFGIPRDNDCSKQQMLIFNFLRTHPYQVHRKLGQITNYLRWEFRTDHPETQEQLSLLKTLLKAGAIATPELLFYALHRNPSDEILTLIVDSGVKLNVDKFPRSWRSIAFYHPEDSFYCLFYRVIDKHFNLVPLVKLFLNAVPNADLSAANINFTRETIHEIYPSDFGEYLEQSYPSIQALVDSKNSPELSALFTEARKKG